jgi:hypothetical protein
MSKEKRKDHACNENSKKKRELHWIVTSQHRIKKTEKDFRTNLSLMRRSSTKFRSFFFSHPILLFSFTLIFSFSHEKNLQKTLKHLDMYQNIWIDWWLGQHRPWPI